VQAPGFLYYSDDKVVSGDSCDSGLDVTVVTRRVDSKMSVTKNFIAKTV